MVNLQLIEMTKSDDLEAARQLIQARADINQQDEHGWTALNWAAGRGNLAMIGLLIENGADVLRTGRDQRRPSLIACAAGHQEAAKLLAEAEERASGRPHGPPQRSYCRAYPLRELRRFSAWAEDVNGLSDDDIVFLHWDLTVTRSMWHNENVIFSRASAEWKQFCETALEFKIHEY